MFSAGHGDGLYILSLQHFYFLRSYSFTNLVIEKLLLVGAAISLPVAVR